MNRLKQRFYLIVSTLALLSFGLSAFAGHASAQAAADGKLRFVHALPGAPAVDVFVDNLLAARGLEYATATRYLNVKAGAHIIAVTPVGTGAQPSGTPLLNAKVTVSTDMPTQLVVIEGTLDKPEAGVFDQDLGPTAPGNTRLTAVHAIKDAPAVDVLGTDGNPLIKDLKYGEGYGAFDIPAATADLTIIPAGGAAGDAVLKADGLALVAGTYNTLVALGTAKGSVKPSYLLLTTPTEPNGAGDGLVRFVNAVSDPKGLDLYIDGKLVVPNLQFGKATEHIALPISTGEISFMQAGDAASAQPLGKQKLTIDGAKVKAVTVVISKGPSGDYTTQSYTDNVAQPDPAKARVNIINAIGGKATLSLNGKVVGNGLETGKQAPLLELAPGAYPLEATVDSPKASVKGILTVNGGTINDLVLVGDESTSQFVVATTSLNEQPGSAPVSLSPVAAGAATAKATTPAAAPPAAATEPAQAVETQPAEDTPTLVPTQPKPTTVPGILGTVNTNADVNLKIREYPRLDARTLALVPSQTVLTVTGVRGPAAKSLTPGPAGTKLPAGTKTATPTLVATARTDVWVFVTWNTSDGGTVTGWVLSSYLDLVNNGKPIGNSNLDAVLAFTQVPEDTPGEVTNTNITPVAGDSNRVIGTVKTNTGTNAQLRRTPGINGESLALVPAEGQVYVISRTDVKLTGLVGEPKSPTWFFVQFDSAGSSVFGWMSADFIVLSRRNKPVDVKEIPVATEITRGFIQGAATSVQPPPKPGVIATIINVNNGANLQLRRTPDVNAESLGLIPPDTQLDVTGRDGSGTWIQVSYNGQTGWVNGQFVKITKNGKKFSVGDIKIVTDQKDTFGTLTPTPSVTPGGAAG